ncbi:hypothetical protein BDZ94DRAFT_1278280 [Collybia nuda]|uniref:DUF6534 domain-containing protein n=1 Tax=Collybia nuda TaxID=64659 RepID=A0A9P5XPU5_9AGAR|nr:hypothetical protein BDZ94DRAFT_1278280 [Collybia nuda]
MDGVTLARSLLSQSTMPDISSVVNGSVIGYIISLVLLGISIVQSWVYAHNNHDRWPLRTFVTLLVLLDITETFCATYIVHHYLISNFGEIEALETPIDVTSVDFAITSIMFFMVHLFFARRLWMLGRSWWLPAVIATTSTAMLALGASAVSSQLLGGPTLGSDLKHRIMIESALCHALGVVTDILVTVGLSRTLSMTHTDLKNTQLVIHRILYFTVTRGILVCLVQIGHVAMYILDPENILFWVSLYLILTKLYVVTTLVTLNSRRSLTATLDNAVISTGDFHLSFARSTSPHADSVNEAEIDCDKRTIILPEG